MRIMFLLLLSTLTLTYQYILPLSSRGLFNWILNRGKSSKTVVPNILKKNGTNEVYKFCVDCEHFLPQINGATYGKCKAFPRTDTLKKVETDYMVSGFFSEAEVEYFYCSSAREYEHMCGRNGTKFQGKQ
jgi:hypothetical protein